MNEIKGISPSPAAEDVINFEDAIGWHPGYGRRENVDTADSCWHSLDWNNDWVEKERLPDGYMSATSLGEYKKYSIEGNVQELT
jgi:hypothetical protein